jgi:branched-chain amino acid transport system substrate-binding protein
LLYDLGIVHLWVALLVRQEVKMSSKWKLCWTALGLTSIAIVLAATACGGGGGGSATPSAEGTPDTTGVTDTEITLGTHYPLSGNPAAAYATIAYGMKAFFDYINAQGGVYGRKINFIIADDHYNPPDTVEVVKKLVEQDHVFGIISGLGEQTHLAVYKYLEERGIPDMYLSTGLEVWSNPVAHNRFAGNPNYIIDGTFLGKYIAKTYPNGKLGILEQGDALGEDGEKGLRQGLEGSNVEIVDVETYDAIQNDVSAQTQRLKSSGADVLAAFAMPGQGASMVKTAHETLSWDVPIIVSAIDVSEIFIALAGPENAEGVVSDVFGMQVYNTEDPGIQKYMKIWDKFQNGVTGPLTDLEEYGMARAEDVVWDLEMAGKDLSRQSFLDAAEKMCRVNCSACAPWGLESTSPTDHKVSETLILNTVVNGKWQTSGEPVSYESTKECTPATPPDGFDQQPKLGKDAAYVETP